MNSTAPSATPGRRWARNPAPAARPGEIEWPTWLLIFLVHAAWLALLVHYQAIGPALAVPMLVLVLTWHSSMSHEILHGHPTRTGWLNDLFAQLPVALMVPYFVFKKNHLRHHRNEDITLPGRDPESFFLPAAMWRRKGPLGRALARAGMTLAGRLIFGPAVAFYRLCRQIGRDIRKRNWRATAGYVAHFCLAAMLVALAAGFQVPVWQYLLAAYLSQSMLLLRSYHEHRPRPAMAQRTVIIESGWLLRLLFLNNNFHAAHHANPGMAWYKLPGEYRRKRARYLEDNGHFYYRGYFSLIKYLFKPVAAPVHPFSPEEP